MLQILYSAGRTCLERPPDCHNNVVCQDGWSLVTGSIILKCSTFYQKYLVFQDRWSLMAVVFQHRFHCIYILYIDTLIAHRPVHGSTTCLERPCTSSRRSHILNAIEPVTKDHLFEALTLLWLMGQSLKTSKGKNVWVNLCVLLPVVLLAMKIVCLSAWEYTMISNPWN